MKIINKLSVAALLAGVVLGSCTLKRDMAVVDPAMTIPAELVDLPSTKVTLDKQVPSTLTIKWNPAEYTYSAGVEYTLQALNDRDTISLGSTFADSITIGSVDLNAAITIALGGAPLTDFNLKLRVMSTIGDEQFNSVSKVDSMLVVPFSGEPSEYYVVGSVQGWSPTEDALIPLFSELSNNSYTGWVMAPYTNDPAAADQIKFLSGPSWTSGEISSADGTISNLVAGGGSNVDLGNTEPELFFIEINTVAFTGEIVREGITSIGIIGSATPGGWDADTDLSWDATEQMFIATGVEMSAGEFKFRCNNDWSTLVWGAGSEPGKLLREGGGDDNIAFSLDPGFYTVKLDLYSFYPTYEFIQELE